MANDNENDTKTGSSIQEGDWAPFCRKLANNLLAFKDDRTELVEAVKHVWRNAFNKYMQKNDEIPPALQNISKEEKRKLEDITDIDPFTVIGLFGRYKDPEKRTAVLDALVAEKKTFKITKEDIPTKFDDMPTLPGLAASFCISSKFKPKEDFETLWSLFEVALKYADNPSDEKNKDKVIQYFNSASKIDRVNTKSITTGLNWIAPETFMNLSGDVPEYIKSLEDAPPTVVQKLNDEISGESYLEILEGLKDYLKNSNLKDFRALNSMAYNATRDGKLTAKPETPETPETSETPETPDTPETPETTETTETLEPNVPKKYWWLNADDGIKDFSEIPVGEVDSSGLLDEQHLSQDFSEVKIGDRVIWHKTGSDPKLLVLCDIVKEQNGEKIIIKKNKELVSYTSLEEIPGLADFKALEGKPGVPVELTKDKYHSIMTLVLRKKFLAEVFMGEDQYEKLVRLLKNKKNIILQGPPGVGKTFAARRLAWSMMGDIDEDRIKLVQFHQNYSYEDFVEGYKPRENGDGFERKSGVFREFCDKARGKEEPYFFIIDEINRGNMSKIFGELLMLIEKDYRGDKYSLELAYSREKFSVPENLYIIGMMNTADRSLAMLDYALRRRFGFVEMEPMLDGLTDKLQFKSKEEKDTFDELITWVKALNNKIKEDESLGEGFRIGHSYFCGWEECTEKKVRDVVECDIIPMLKEYWFDNPGELEAWTTQKNDYLKKLNIG